eukprot:COSAG01_NODE_52055_length_349_cov_1.352000_1_plen_20_part_10
MHEPTAVLEVASALYLAPAG